VSELEPASVAWLLAAAVAISALASGAAHAVTTLRLRRLLRALDAFELGRGTTALRLVGAGAGRDELARVALRLEAMCERLVAQSDQLTAKEQEQRELLGNVSHDLRTPLASVQGYLELLLLRQGSLDSAEARNYLETAARQTERLGRLVADLFELTRLEADGVKARNEDFAIAELAQDIAQKFAGDAERRGVRLEARVAPGAPESPPLRVRADIGLVERALGSLIENALRHTPSGGSVTLDAERCGGRARLVVSDTGEGIAAADLPGIFDRYQRAERIGPAPRASGHGGLGLAIARRIAILHDGTLAIDSVERQGTRISFDLPLAERLEEEACLPTR
jgi:signal transduction histidine kinase